MDTADDALMLVAQAGMHAPGRVTVSMHWSRAWLEPHRTCGVVCMLLRIGCILACCCGCGRLWG